MAKATFTAELSRQFDILQAKEATILLVWMPAQKGRVSFPCQHTTELKPSEANWNGLSKSTEESLLGKLNVILKKNWKEHDCILFQSNGLALKQGELFFFYGLNIEEIKCVEANLTKARQDTEAPENTKRGYDRTITGTHKQHISKRRRKRKAPKVKWKKEEADWKQRSTSSWNVCRKPAWKSSIIHCAPS